MLIDGEVKIEAKLLQDSLRYGYDAFGLWMEIDICPTRIAHVLQEKIRNKALYFSLREAPNLDYFIRSLPKWLEKGIVHETEIAEDFSEADPYWTYCAIHKDFCTIVMYVNSHLDLQRNLIPFFVTSIIDYKREPFVTFDGWCRHQNAKTVNATEDDFLNGEAAVFGRCNLSFRIKDKI